MIGARIARVLLSQSKRQIIPKPPKILSGELEPFRFEFENEQLYKGYTMEQLYGKRYGVKHPPAIKAEMVKDNIAAILIFVLGIGLTLHYNSLFKKELQAVRRVEATKMSKVVELPPVRNEDLH